MTCALYQTTAGQWAALGAGSAAAEQRLVTNQGAATVRVLAATAAPASDVGRTLAGGESVLLPLAAGDSVWVHCAAVQTVIVSGPAATSGGAVISSRLAVEPLGAPICDAQGSAGASVASHALQTTTKRLSLLAETAGVVFALGGSAADAAANVSSTATTRPGQARIRVPAGSRCDILVAAGQTHLAWMRSGSTDGFASILEYP